MSQDTPPPSESWAAGYAERAREYWTEARLRELVGDKRIAILPSEAPVLLRAVGLLNRDGSMPPAKVRKYRQINHMVSVLRPTLRAVTDRFESVRLLDAACGRSYLSTLLAWHFVHNLKHPVQILGVDRRPELVAESRRRAQLIGLSHVLRFQTGDLAALDLQGVWRSAYGATHERAIHGVLSLHGCDTATDDALALAFSEAAAMVAVVPCCQVELSRRWAERAGGADAPLGPLWSSPHLRRAAAAHTTDFFRLLLMRAQGYEATAIEFVPSEHTPKNTLLRGVLRSSSDPEALRQYERAREAMGGVGIGLETRLRTGTNATGSEPCLESADGS